MKVKELIELLKEAPQDADVLLSQDAEGNGFDTACFVEVSKYDGEVPKLLELTPELEAQGYCEEDVGDPSDPIAVFIWP